MKIIRFALSVLGVVCLVGCGGIKTPSWIPFTGKSAQQVVPELKQTKKSIEYAPLNMTVSDGKMINPDRLAKGGSVLLVPFRAGENVVASDELNKIAYRVMQGLSNSLGENPPYFKILINDKEALPDYYIDGYFTRKQSTPDVAKMFLLRKKYVLGVEGKLMDANTNEVLATFSDTVESNNPEEDFVFLGFKVGINIGEFVHTNIHEE